MIPKTNKNTAPRINLGEITFRGVSYPTRVVDIPGYGEELISTEELNKVLFDDNDNYVSNEAKHIDEEIFFFAPDKAVRTFDDEKIAELALGTCGDIALSSSEDIEEKAHNYDRLFTIAYKAIGFMAEHGLSIKDIADYLGASEEELAKLGLVRTDENKASESIEELVEQTKKDVQLDFASYANGHSEYMVVNVDEDNFLKWAVEKSLGGECIGGVKFERGQRYTNVARFSACEKYEPQMVDELKKAFPDAAVYGFGMWDIPAFVTSEDEYQYFTEAENYFVDGDGFRLDVRITDARSKCSACVGDLFSIETPEDIKKLKAGENEYFARLKDMSWPNDEAIDAMLDHALAEREAK